jgi:hypothetical protein
MPRSSGKRPCPGVDNAGDPSPPMTTPDRSPEAEPSFATIVAPLPLAAVGGVFALLALLPSLSLELGLGTLHLRHVARRAKLCHEQAPHSQSTAPACPTRGR